VVSNAITRHSFHSYDWQVLEERVGDSTSADRQFVWGLRYVDDQVLRDRDPTGNGTLGERCYAFQDANWNAVAISDATGAIQERVTYTAYGMPRFVAGTFAERTSSAYAWETLYSGYRWDELVEAYHVRHRVFLPRLGRWNRQDPIDVEADINLYRYVQNRSTTFIDPFGDRPVLPQAPSEGGGCGSLAGCIGGGVGSLPGPSSPGIPVRPILSPPVQPGQIYPLPPPGGGAGLPWPRPALPSPRPISPPSSPAGLPKPLPGINVLDPKGPNSADLLDPWSDYQEERCKKTWKCSAKPRGHCPKGCDKPFGSNGTTRDEAKKAAFEACVAAGCHTPGGKEYSCNCGHITCTQSAN